MTPLAHWHAKQLTVPLRERSYGWREPENSKLLAGMLADIHCFDCTQVIPMMNEMTLAIKKIEKTGGEAAVDAVFDGRVFLPAPKTWIELNFEFVVGKPPARVGFLLEEIDDGKWARFTALFKDAPPWAIGTISTTDRWNNYLGTPTLIPRDVGLWSEQLSVPLNSQFSAFVHYLLVIINTPRIIGRRQHMPHAGLERKLLKSLDVAGKFPLHAWTEILLEATSTYIDESGIEHEAHLTGKKCLHFCRKHLRIRNGKLETVSSHWRGDPALGLKQSRYTVVPPKSKRRTPLLTSATT